MSLALQRCDAAANTEKPLTVALLTFLSTELKPEVPPQVLNGYSLSTLIDLKRSDEDNNNPKESTFAPLNDKKTNLLKLYINEKS